MAKQPPIYSLFKTWLAHKVILSQKSTVYFTVKRKLCLGVVQTTFRDFDRMNKFEFSKRLLCSTVALNELHPFNSFESSNEKLNEILTLAKEIQNLKTRLIAEAKAELDSI